jgi:pimeloyl-ACP methyl ester carboxylesterase
MIKKAFVFIAISTGLVGALYMVFCILLYAMQDDMVFYRVGNDAALRKQWQAKRVEIPAGDVAIEGWWAENANAGNVTLLYFGGNAEDVLYMAEGAGRFNARVLLTNYRGYGATPGRPSEQALLKDSLAVYDYAVTQASVSADNIIVMGRSLGSGVAAHIAANRPVRGAVLITPYDSMASVAQAHYRYFPVRLLLKHQFASDKLAAKITQPVLILAAERDGVVPPVHAQRLFAAWAGPKQMHVLENVGHNDIEHHEQYYPLINGFLEKQPVASAKR